MPPPGIVSSGRPMIPSLFRSTYVVFQLYSLYLIDKRKEFHENFINRHRLPQHTHRKSHRYIRIFSTSFAKNFFLVDIKYYFPIMELCVYWKEETWIYLILVIRKVCIGTTVPVVFRIEGISWWKLIRMTAGYKRWIK